MISPLAERNLQIVKMRESGQTLRAIGRHFDLCAETISHICKKHERKRKARLARIREKFADALWKQHPSRQHVYDSNGREIFSDWELAKIARYIRDAIDVMARRRSADPEIDRFLLALRRTSQ